MTITLEQVISSRRDAHLVWHSGPPRRLLLLPVGASRDAPSNAFAEEIELQRQFSAALEVARQRHLVEAGGPAISGGSSLDFLATGRPSGRKVWLQAVRYPQLVDVEYVKHLSDLRSDLSHVLFFSNDSVVEARAQSTGDAWNVSVPEFSANTSSSFFDRLLDHLYFEMGEPLAVGKAFTFKNS